MMTTDSQRQDKIKQVQRWYEDKLKDLQREYDRRMKEAVK